MTGDFMDAARDQMLVLIEEQKELLKVLLGEEDLLRRQKEDGKERVLSKEEAANTIEILEGEADKASRLEITLAVAGTVKAGKSTAVNAIIGTEALPNRTRPMTALPTLIRHTPDRFDPGLTINNVGAFNELARRIAHKLQDEMRLDAVQKEHKADMTALIDDLTESASAIFDKEYEGRDRVFEVLGRINDLLRLGRHDAVVETLPVEEYDELKEMPTLAVHFRCLADTAQQSGSLALLDLPGFNEAKHSEHLKVVIKEQMEKASAILVVLDYTQLKTEASEELEQLLDAVSAMMRDRLFILVNKFDQRNSSGDSVAEIKAYISDNLLNGVIDPQHVYPVSALRAYLASRALDALTRNHVLPSVDDEPWVADFCDLCFLGDNAKLQDLEEVNKVAGRLWDQSGFEPLLDGVVVAAQREAGTIALDSTLDKLKIHAGKIEHHLEIRAKTLTKGVEELEKTIRSMNDSIQAAEKAAGDFDRRIDSAMCDISRNIGKILIDANSEVSGNIEDIFNRAAEGIANAGRSERKELVSQSTWGSFVWSLFGSNQDDKRDWIRELETFKREGKLKYDNKDDCDKVWAKVSQIYSSVAAQILTNASSSIKDVVNQTHKSLESDLDIRLRDILVDAQRTLETGGIKVKLEVGNVNFDEDLSSSTISRLSRNVETRINEPYTVVTHRLANFLDPFDLFGWGKVEVPEKTIYEINRDRAIAALEKGLAGTLKNYWQHVEAGMEDWRRHAKDSLDGIRNHLDRYHQTLIDGLADRRMQRESREQVLAVIKGIKRRSDDSRANLKDFETAKGRVLSVQ